MTNDPRKPLMHLVQFRDKIHPWWETIAGFNSEAVAVSYGRNCFSNFGPHYAELHEIKYRVVEQRRGKGWVEVWAS